MEQVKLSLKFWLICSVDWAIFIAIVPYKLEYFKRSKKRRKKIGGKRGKDKDELYDGGIDSKGPSWGAETADRPPGV